MSNEVKSEAEVKSVEGKVKTHFKENKKTYIVGAGCFIAGATSVFFLRGGSIQIVDAIKIQLWSPTTNTVQLIQNVTRQGPPSWIVENKSTGEKFMSQRRAAFMNGIRPTDLSDHLNGLRPDVNGQTYERVGLRINPEVK